MASGLTRLVIGADPRRTLLRIGVLIVAAWLLITYGILSVRGQGPSMLPTVKDGQLMIVDTVSYRLRRPRRGELAAVRWEDDRAVLIKRILAGPGDTVAMTDGIVVVNDVELAEPYVQHRAPWNMGATTLSPDQFFVVGDNRGMPMELHTFGTVERADLIGPVFWIVGN